MSSYIADHRRELERRHYIRKAAGKHYWFDVFANKIEKYLRRFGNSFCVVLYASEQEDDAYVIPFLELTAVFVDELLDDRGRWHGVIRDGYLDISVCIGIQKIADLLLSRHITTPLRC